MKPSIYRDLLFALAIGVFVQACAHGPYKGRVLDEITGEPVAGAVAVGDWTYTVPTPGGAVTECLDAREALTDENGEFEIPNVSWGIFSISVYKVGYHRVQCMWKYMSEWGTCFTEPVELDGDRAVFPLRRDRLGTAEGNYPSTCGRKDGKPLSALREARKEYRRALGLEP